MGTGMPESEGMVASKNTTVQVEKVCDATLTPVKKKIPGSGVTAVCPRDRAGRAGAEARSPDVVQAVVQAGGRGRFVGALGSELEAARVKLVNREQ